MLFEIIQEHVDFMFTDVGEIGTSDVSICVDRVIRDYAPYTNQFASTPTRQVIRRAVQCCLQSLEDLHEFQILEMITPKALELYHSS